MPGTLLGTSLSAFLALSVLPAAGVPAQVVAQSTAPGGGSLALLRNDLMPQPVLPPPVKVAAPVDTPKATPKPTLRPTKKRATRSRSVAAALERLNTNGYACPVAGRVSFSDTWGEPRSGGRSHKGTDLMAAYGTPVAAVTSGTVRTASSSAGGLSIYLRGDDGVEYFYAHNSRNSVRSGQRVTAGQIIGAVGTSGNAPSSAPHVHFERNPGGGSVNPYPFVRRVC